MAGTLTRETHLATSTETICMVEWNYSEPRTHDLEIGDVVRVNGYDEHEYLLVTRLEPFDEPEDSTVVPPQIGEREVGYIPYEWGNKENAVEEGHVNGVIRDARILEKVGNIRNGNVTIQTDA